MDQEENQGLSMIMDFGQIPNNMMQREDDDDEEDPSVEFDEEEKKNLDLTVSTEQEDDDDEEDDEESNRGVGLMNHNEQENVAINEQPYPQSDMNHYAEQFYEPQQQQQLPPQFIDNAMTPAINYRHSNFHQPYSTPINLQNPPMPAFATPAVPSIDEEPYLNINSNPIQYHTPDYGHQNPDNLGDNGTSNNNENTVISSENTANLANLQAQHHKPLHDLHSMNRFGFQPPSHSQSPYIMNSEHQQPVATTTSTHPNEIDQEFHGCNDECNRKILELQMMLKVRGKKLEHYMSLCHELKEKDMRALKHELDMTKQEKERVMISNNELKKICDELDIKARKATDDALNKQVQFNKSRETILDLERKIEQLEGDLNCAHATIEKFDNNEALEKVKFKSEYDLQRLRDQLEQFKHQKEEDMGNLQQDLEEKKQHIDHLIKQLEVAQKNLEKFRIEKLDYANLLGASDNDKDLMISSLSREINTLRDQIQQYPHQTPPIPIINDQAEHEELIESYKNDIEKLKGDLRIEYEENQQKIHTIHELKNENDKLIAENDELRMELSKTDPQSIEMAYQRQYQSRVQELELNHTKEMQIAGETIQRLQGDLNKANEAARKIEAELTQAQKMYRDLCTEKANLHDMIRTEMESEYKKDQAQRVLELEKFENLLEREKTHSQDLQNKFDKVNLQFIRLQSDIESLQRVNTQLEQQLNEKSIAVDTNSEIQREKEQLIQQVNSLKEQIASYESMVSQKESVIEEIKSSLLQETNELKEKLASSEASLKQTQLVMDEAKASFELDKTRMIDQLACEQVKQTKMKSEFDEEKARLNDAIKELNNKLASFDELSRERDMAVNDKIKLEQELSQITQEKRKCEEKYQHQLITIDTLNKDIMELRHQIEARKTEYEEILSKSMESKTSEQEQLQSRLVQLGEELRVKALELDESNKSLKKCQQELINAKTDVKHFQIQIKKMEEREAEVNQGLDMLDQQHKNEIDEANRLLDNAQSRIQKLEHDLQVIGQTNVRLVAELEEQKQLFKTKLNEELDKKEKENQRVVVNIRQEYQDNMDAFAKRHLDQMAKMVREKTTEFDLETQKLLERNAANLDKAEQSWRTEVKELKSQIAALSVRPRIDSKETQTELNESSSDTSMLNKTDQVYTESQFTTNLMSTIQAFESKLKEAEDRIRELDECLTKADEHCINELQKQRDQLEEEYKRKLESVTYGSEFLQLQDSYEVLFGENQAIKSELESKQRELLKCEAELSKVKSESATYRKSMHDNSKLVESLRHEMVTIINKNMTETTLIKMKAEREKEDMRLDLTSKMKLLEKELEESDEASKRKCDMLKADLEQKHDLQMSDMRARMNDMMRQHGTAIERVKKQYQRQFDVTRVSMETTNHSCQTDMSCEDINKLEAMPKSYAQAAQNMKDDFMQQYDSIVSKCEKKIDQQLKLERDYVQSCLKSYYIPAVINSSLSWSQLGWSENLSSTKQAELEQQLDKVIRGLPPRDRSGSKTDETKSSPRSNLNPARTSTSSLANALSFSQQRTNLADNLSKQSAFTLTPGGRDNEERLSQILAKSRDQTPTTNLVTSSRAHLLSSASQIKSPTHSYQYTSIKNFGSHSQHSPSNSPLTHSASSSSTNFNLHYTERSSTLRNEIDSSRRPNLQNFKTIAVNRPMAENVDPNFVHNWDREYKKSQQVDEPVDFEAETPAGEPDELSPGMFQKNEFHKKYRAQNIRQKKSTRDMPSSGVAVETYRPQSVTNLCRATSDYLPVTSNIHKSIQDLTGNKDTVSKSKSYNSKQMRIDIESDNDMVPSREDSDPEGVNLHKLPKQPSSSYLTTTLRSQSSVGITTSSKTDSLMRTSEKKLVSSGSSSSSSSSTNLKKVSSGISTSSHCASSTNSLPRSNSRSRTPTSSSSSSSSATAEVINENFYMPQRSVNLDSGGVSSSSSFKATVDKKVDLDYKKMFTGLKKPPFK